ncbi:MAG TPA: hypothetical protein PK297_10340, partial [Spirochaetota bacterium]|nr:hypothetical protein [Spirochaetota bacterium]
MLDADDDTENDEDAEVIDDDSEDPDEEGFPESSSSEQPAQTKDMTQRLARSRRIMGTSPRVRYSSGNRMVSIEYTMKNTSATGNFAGTSCIAINVTEGGSPKGSL